MLSSVCLCVISAMLPDVAVSAASVRTSYRLRFQLPFSGWNEVVRSNATPTSTRTPTRETWEAPMLGLALAADLAQRWTVELGTGIVLTSGGFRGQIVALRFGRRPEGGGSLLQLAGLATVAYRGQAYNINSEGGQRTLSIGAAAALEFTYFTSRTFGWSVRARPSFSYALWQLGDSVWTGDDEGVLLWADGCLMQVGIGIDLGMTF